MCSLKMLSLDVPFSNMSLVTSSPMLGLPEEIFLYVLSHLDTRAKLSAAQVCKTWRDTMDDWNLWKGVTAHLSIHQDINVITPVLEQRRINRVRISQVSSKCLQQVDRGMVDGKVDFTALCNLTRVMSNHLSSLNLFNLPVPNDKVCEALTPTMSKLTELILCHGICYNTTTCKTLAASCGKLEKLVCCGFLMRNSDIAALGIGMPNLHELDLSQGHYSSLFWFNNHSATFVERYMPKLTKLNLSTCYISRSGLVSLSRLEALQELNLQYCADLPDDCIRVLSKGACGQKLTVLNVKCCKFMNAKSVLTSMADHPLPLTEFSISSYEWCRITDDNIRALLQSGKHLQTLRLYNRTCITHVGLHMIAKTCTKLKTFVISREDPHITGGINIITNMASKPQVIYHTS